MEKPLSKIQEEVRKPRRRPTSQIPTARSSNSVQNLYSWIRSAILNGKFAAGEAINQAQLAVQFGVSRTPLREALRMLQAEGLLVGEINQRMRVASISPSEIDSLYATRILLECFGVAVTVPRLSASERRTLEAALRNMNAHAWIGDRPTWEVYHTDFHSMLVKHADLISGPVLKELIANFQLRCERYRRLYVKSDPKNRQRAIEDHTRIVEAVVAGSVGAAVTRLADHFSHTAFAVMRDIAPDVEPVAVRNSLAICRTIDAGMDYQDMLGVVMGLSLQTSDAAVPRAEAVALA
jgi:DNA-binding GntR family transcriptional regulator